jgi:hypothetical protein
MTSRNYGEQDPVKYMYLSDVPLLASKRQIRRNKNLLSVTYFCWRSVRRRLLEHSDWQLFLYAESMSVCVRVQL